ncbi:MAG: zinc dependent phospholipase C family protein [Butyricicoccus pullicaecorum]|nr:zinc dependent phospholipase C family protein [Butyricicoccus pullicaecorum]
MDSISHTRVANLLLAHIETETGVTFDANAFRYGNLKPDLTGTYLTKRHYPSIMFEEVKDKIRTFCRNYTLADVNGRELSVDLGEICHYLTDFFCYPHNDDIYPHGLFLHYVYEKRVALCLRRSLTEAHFEGWVENIVAPFSAEALIARIEKLHAKYKALPHHSIVSDMEFICQVTTLCVKGIINISYVCSEEKTGITA